MELIFIRHGQGEHTLNLPESLHLDNPALTTQGRMQAKKLRWTLPLTPEDVLIVSPTLRTLQTASIWSENIDCAKVVHPLVAPRIFPARQTATTLPCDELLGLERLYNEFSDFTLAPNLAASLWSTGINILKEDEFNLLIEEFISFCRNFQRERIYIVTHDGTATSYRQQVLGQQLTREDFLQETERFHPVVE